MRLLKLTLATSPVFFVEILSLLNKTKVEIDKLLQKSFQTVRNYLRPLKQ